MIKKILLIADEIQSGYFRSSKMFAFEHANIKPDIITVAKGIGGGFPIGAVLLNKSSKMLCPRLTWKYLRWISSSNECC